ncbi:ATPase subunit of ABC transporter with duplicated ATPase domains [Kribbella sp. VKM Ac-2527]|uniref:ATPase subunit of ABC transporter with duplicated ATPase domains n=1 Tax=Kribbella caucasensis TaxID=2512215 RepID=A0A4R6KNR4_9ACTN|nr:ABC-F family ATP-binding cassette domain-containing protein [Kribbella sp. VKM Ac-2527]TDO52295.1 ATPase subunit of ABC transporter with duplicated ATPase domains [Kribbella sp. VKM Ac-2527]
MASLTCHDLYFAWPDGDVLFDGLSFVAGPMRSGLVGRNGVGKSTLLKLIAGRLNPQRGSIRATGELAYLPQDLTLDTTLQVDQALGIAEIRRAITAIEQGDASEQNFTTVGDGWDAEERAEAMLGKLGLGAIGLDRSVGELSGGETILLGLAAELLKRPDVLLLDEPTNNLDLRARRHLYEAVESFRGALIVVSHDRELLDRVDQIGDLRKGDITWYGGNLTAYEEAVAIEQEAAQRLMRSAESDVRKQKRDLIEARMKMDRRRAAGQRAFEQGGIPKIIAGGLKRSAQVSAGKHLGMQSERLEAAQDALADAEERVHDDDTIRVDLPKTEVPAGRVVLKLEDLVLRTGLHVDLEIRGPERIALIGPNGAGKSTLLHAITEEELPRVPYRLLPQRLDLLRDELSVVENLALLAPSAENQERRARLARFLFRGRAADQPVSTLSGGERFRATLAALLLAEPPPQLLMLDEPTNNLDLSSVAQLQDALASYQGALLIASHDLPFLREIGITRWLQLDNGELTGIDPPFEPGQ